MTHTLNRIGLSEEKPGEEIVFLCMVHDKEKPTKADRLKEVTRIVAKYNPINIVGRPLGFDDQSIMELTKKVGIVTAVFTNKDDALEMVKEIKDKQLGLSVVISALFSDVHEICENLSIDEHTYHISLGVYGQTNLLPDMDILSITTQCGHHMVSPNLVKHVVTKIRKGKMAAQEAAELLVRPCACGLINHERVKKTLDKMAVVPG